MVDRALLRAQAVDSKIPQVSKHLSATHYDSQIMY